MSVVDPFLVEEGWFVLSCPSCLIEPGDGLDGDVSRWVQDSIDVLDLNSHDLVDERSKWLVDVAEGIVPFEHLTRKYPFLAHEVTRQGIEDELATLFSVPR
ncbi:MAG: hypothetical protein F4112_12400 [Holophagales bacterium]|nr:hypothetical protein [Holophagales bacterium]MYD20860.1 hypothetical protein [Holophagales bacterium]MYI33753.1 hypothetical protein [Holophagales bacterium]